MTTEHRDYWPPELVVLVEQVTYKPWWSIYLGEEFADDGAGGLKLFIISQTPDSYNPDREIRVRHEFLVPRASYTRVVWTAWLFERLCDVESHEAGEFFQVDGVRMFGPHHADGENPYRMVQVDGGDLIDTQIRAGESRAQYLARKAGEELAVKADPIPEGWEPCDQFGMHPIGAHDDYVADNA